MTLWLDAQLPPQLAGWIEANLQMKAVAVRDLGLRDSSDREIFAAARVATAILISKDATLSSWSWAAAHRQSSFG